MLGFSLLASQLAIAGLLTNIAAFAIGGMIGRLMRPQYQPMTYVYQTVTEPVYVDGSREDSRTNQSYSPPPPLTPEQLRALRKQAAKELLETRKEEAIQRCYQRELEKQVAHKLDGMRDVLQDREFAQFYNPQVHESAIRLRDQLLMSPMADAGPYFNCAITCYMDEPTGYRKNAKVITLPILLRNDVTFPIPVATIHNEAIDSLNRYCQELGGVKGTDEEKCVDRFTAGNLPN